MVARRLASSCRPGEVIDLVEQVSVQVPVLVIAELLGVGDGDLGDFRRWSDAMIEISDDPTPETFAVTLELFAFLNEHIAGPRGRSHATT